MWIPDRPLPDPEPGYKSLDHVTDALIESWGKTFESALEQAALGLFDTVVDVSTVRPLQEKSIAVEGHDELELVFNWLEKMLLSFEIDGWVFARIQVAPVRASTQGFQLSARALGEKYDPKIHRGK